MELLAVFTTVATEADADALATAAVEQGLAACVQVEAIRSTYRWEGAVQREPEYRLLFKTTRMRGPALERLLRERHPYGLPAIWALPVAGASADYADWVYEACTPPGQA